MVLMSIERPSDNDRIFIDRWMDGWMGGEIERQTTVDGGDDDDDDYGYLRCSVLDFLSCGDEMCGLG